MHTHCSFTPDLLLFSFSKESKCSNFASFFLSIFFLLILCAMRIRSPACLINDDWLGKLYWLSLRFRFTCGDDDVGVQQTIESFVSQWEKDRHTFWFSLSIWSTSWQREKESRCHCITSGDGGTRVALITHIEWIKESEKRERVTSSFSSFLDVYIYI